ncbi:MAG: Uncharacterized protein G01um10148_213 [Parcubacteria group bacterium Gr01-1014_8]|nr:MAG: Uncharacterized protein G01um10148_213 [Parcubacteria group bacterium Gr01-1014_8]
MTWASRRRTIYASGVTLFFLIVLGVPLAIWWYQPANCTDGEMNGAETDVDRGGNCPLLDERTLIPHAIQWARAFPVRDGTWSAVAYVENPNDQGGVAAVPYRFKLYDDRNIIVAEREGTTYIMPGAVTPIYEGGISTGNRSVARAYFEFAAPLVWERMSDRSRAVDVTGKAVSDADSMPRVTAFAENTEVSDAKNVEFVSVIFDPAGNAIAASSTVLPLLKAGERANLVFTWPDPYIRAVGRVDVIPLRAPVLNTANNSFF